MVYPQRFTPGRGARRKNQTSPNPTTRLCLFPTHLFHFLVLLRSCRRRRRFRRRRHRRRRGGAPQRLLPTRGAQRDARPAGPRPRFGPWSCFAPTTTPSMVVPLAPANDADGDPSPAPDPPTPVTPPTRTRRRWPPLSRTLLLRFKTTPPPAALPAVSRHRLRDEDQTCRGCRVHDPIEDEGARQDSRTTFVPSPSPTTG